VASNVSCVELMMRARSSAGGLEYELARGAVLDEIEKLGRRTANLPQSSSKARGAESWSPHAAVVEPIDRHHLPEEEEARVPLRHHPAPLDLISRQRLTAGALECRR